MGLVYKQSTLKVVWGFLFNLVLLANILIIENQAKILLINFGILITYFLHFPRYIFNPRNMVFAFSFLYVILPSTIQVIYEVFELDYVLPWGQVVDWFSFHLITYVDMYIVFIVFFYTFMIFESREKNVTFSNFKIQKFYFTILLTFTIGCVLLFVQLSGGIIGWVNNYKESFLLGREGLGLLNFITLFLVNILVFVLGLIYFKSKKYKVSILVISLLLIVLFALIQGLKSRLIILLLIFFFPYLLQRPLKIKTFFILGVTFFLLLFIGTYIRSNGYYDSGSIFFEYLMTYFNAYSLHDMIVQESEPNFFHTIYYPLVKPLIALGFLEPNTAYDISIELTKKYFPNDWETMNATQQWPLVTELYYNYYGFFLGWVPIIIYIFIISKLYKRVKDGNFALGLIFILEFLRIFSVFRGVLIPWQMPMYIVLYVFTYIAVNQIVVRKG